MKNFIKRELSGWKSWEIIWFIVCCVIIGGLSVYWKDNMMGIVSAITGVACVVCTGKGKLSAYIFGLINCVLYAYISYKAKLYGETMLNVIYYVPMQFYGFCVWRKNMNQETNEVTKRHMTNKLRVLCILAILLGTVMYGAFLRKIGGTLPFVDAFTTVSPVVALIISIKMFSEQWWLWFVVDLLTVMMWISTLPDGSAATLLMWMVYLINAVVMCVKWETEIHRDKNVRVKA
jgi:nicotinamide mononucleotide transporter